MQSPVPAAKERVGIADKCMTHVDNAIKEFDKAAVLYNSLPIHVRVACWSSPLLPELRSCRDSLKRTRETLATEWQSQKTKALEDDELKRFRRVAKKFKLSVAHLESRKDQLAWWYAIKNRTVDDLRADSSGSEESDEEE